MQSDVEKVAAIFCLSHGSGLCPRRCDACIDDARAAMAATLELAAADLREMTSGLVRHRIDVADWLDQRAAKEIRDGK